MLFKRETNILVIFNSDKFHTYFDFDLSTMIMYTPPHPWNALNVGVKVKESSLFNKTT